MDFSLWAYFYQSDLIVKLVLLTLLSFSLLSWTVIIHRYWAFRSELSDIHDFENEFWNNDDLMKTYQKYSHIGYTAGMSSIFVEGIREFLRLRKLNQPYHQMMEAVLRSMQIERVRIEAKLQKHLSFLASVGSISPYIGLLGTVWGIMTAFKSLGQMQQVSMQSVAPGISEALLATALGLFAAIPAVWAFNHFSHYFLELNERYQNYEAQLLNILNRQIQLK